MSDNIIKFKRKPAPEPQHEKRPLVGKMKTLAVVAALFICAYTYFSLTGR